MLEAILLPVAVLAAIGVLAGIMLALFSYFMKVPTDQKLEGGARHPARRQLRRLRLCGL